MTAELSLTVNGEPRRIAAGSGTTPADINQLMNQFTQMQKMLKSLGGLGAMGSGRVAQRRAMEMLRNRR